LKFEFEGTIYLSHLAAIIHQKKGYFGKRSIENLNFRKILQCIHSRISYPFACVF